MLKVFMGEFVEEIEFEGCYKGIVVCIYKDDVFFILKG